MKESTPKLPFLCLAAIDSENGVVCCAMRTTSPTLCCLRLESKRTLPAPAPSRSISGERRWHASVKRRGADDAY
jgi:hypothetical protein